MLDVNLNLRISAQDRAVLHAAAAVQGRSASEFIREVAVEAALEELGLEPGLEGEKREGVVAVG